MTHESICTHPTNEVVYEHVIDEDDLDVERYWCRICRFYLPPVTVQEIQERPDWVTWQSE
jgi:hypothetical protein